MKKEFLTELGLTDEQIKSIQAENGKDIEAAKAKFADYEETKTALQKAQDTIAGFGDVEAIKADVEKYKTEAETAKTEAAKKLTAATFATPAEFLDALLEAKNKMDEDEVPEEGNGAGSADCQNRRKISKGRNDSGSRQIMDKNCTKQ